MKTRQGFVSNSSTTSFVCKIADTANKPTGYFDILDILRLIYKQNQVISIKDGEIFFQPAKSTKFDRNSLLKTFTLEEYIGELTTQIFILIGEIKENKLRQNDLRQFSSLNKKTRVAAYRLVKGQYADLDADIRDCTYQLNPILNKLKNLLKRRKELRLQLLLSQNSQENITVITFTCDNWDEYKLREYLEKAGVEILERTST